MIEKVARMATTREIVGDFGNNMAKRALKGHQRGAAPIEGSEGTVSWFDMGCHLSSSITRGLFFSYAL